MKTCFTCALLLLLCISLTAQESAEATFNQLFGDAYQEAKKTPDTSDNTQLGKDILSAFDGIEGEKELKAYAYEQVIDLASVNGTDSKIALEAASKLKALGKAYHPVAQAALLDITRKQFAVARGEQKSALANKLGELLIQQAALQLSQGKSSEAMATYRELRGLIRFSDKITGQMVSDLIRSAQASVTINKKIETLEEQLLTSPSAEAAAELAKLMLIERDDTKAAAKYAPFSQDEKLKEVVQLAQVKFDDLT